MNFEAVFRMLIERFEREKIRFALIGGFALQVVGYTRATSDIDFLVVKEDVPKVKKTMLSLGYELPYESEDVSTFISRLGELGRVDFLHAHRKYSVAMLDNASEKEILGGKIRVRVIRAEDIIGLKIQSSSNDPLRYHQDMADIEEVIKANHGKLDLKVLREYFLLFGRQDELEKILEKVTHVE